MHGIGTQSPISISHGRARFPLGVRHCPTGPIRQSNWTLYSLPPTMEKQHRLTDLPDGSPVVVWASGTWGDREISRRTQGCCEDEL